MSTPRQEYFAGLVGQYNFYLVFIGVSAVLCFAVFLFALLTTFSKTKNSKWLRDAQIPLQDDYRL